MSNNHNWAVHNAMSLFGAYNKRRYIRKSKHLDRCTEKMLMGILRRNQNTELGKKWGFASIHSIQDYQDRIPFTSYDDYVEYVDRIAKTGEQNLVTADKVTFLATTSGTTGVMKRIPVNRRSFMPVLRSTSCIYNIILDEMKKRGVTRGRGLITLESGCTFTESGIRQGFISSFVMSSGDLVVTRLSVIPPELSGYGEEVDMKYVKARYALADRDMAFIISAFMSSLVDLTRYIADSKDLLIRDIEQGVIDPSVKMPPELRAELEAKLSPDPKRAAELREALDFSQPKGVLRRAWPRLCVLVAIGSGELEPFTRKMRSFCGEEVAVCHKLYASSEATFGTVIRAEDDQYLLLPDSGFFEFIPMGEPFDEKKDRPLLPYELEVGKHYEVVVTNLAGLYRYRIKDVVLVSGFLNQSPLLRFAYRHSQVINITGLKLTSEHLVSTMRALSERLGVNIIDYSIYADTEQVPWRLVLFVEFDGDAPQGVDLSLLFDEELAKVNQEHGHMLDIGETSPSTVCVMKRNTYSELREENASHKTSSNQVKTVRYIGTRELYNQFMERVAKVYERGI